jgi:hypothetical protein
MTCYSKIELWCTFCEDWNQLFDPDFELIQIEINYNNAMNDKTFDIDMSVWDNAKMWLSQRHSIYSMERIIDWHIFSGAIFRWLICADCCFIEGDCASIFPTLWSYPNLWRHWPISVTAVLRWLPILIDFGSKTGVHPSMWWKAIFYERVGCSVWFLLPDRMDDRILAKVRPVAPHFAQMCSVLLGN